MDGMSDLSWSVSSRAEQMAYLKNELGLDHATAARLYRAGRLQEKGQLKLALVYFKKVIAVQPDRVEAQDNARITQEALAEQVRCEKQNVLLQSISEDVASSTGYTTTEMEIDWSGWDDSRFDYYAAPDELAVKAAKKHLRATGHGGSLLKLVHNETLKDICNAETEWESFKSGRALFQVTLIRDLPEEPLPSSNQQLLLEAQIAQRLASLGSLSGDRSTTTRVASTESVVDAPPSISTMSMFADAESKHGTDE